MKKRTSFVTNSSSSSFVIALKEVSTDDIGKFVESHREEITKFLKDDYCDYDSDEELAEQVEEAIDDIKRKLKDVRGDGIKLDSWTVVAFEASNDGDPADTVFYNGILQSTDNIIIKAVY